MIPRPSGTPYGSETLTIVDLPGHHLGPQNGPKLIQTRSKIEAEIQDEKKVTQDDLGPILERSWVDLGLILGSFWAKNQWKT